MTQNYKDLLCAIFHSDESERNVKSVVCVYDVLDNERLVGVFSSSQACGDFFGTTRKVIDRDVCRKLIKSKRYKIERVKLDTELQQCDQCGEYCEELIDTDGLINGSIGLVCEQCIDDYDIG